jgi:glycosyltransferase involved in cell wall biosynthesis
MHSGERYKGHDLLLDLWPRLRQQIPDAQLVIAGDGNDRERLRARAMDLELDKAVRFTGLVSGGELAWLYQHCRFFVMPSRGEGFGLVYLEAMRAAKACIGGMGAAAEIIADGRTGRIVDPADPETVYQAVLRMFSEETETVEMGRAGQQRFLMNFTENQFGRRLRQALELNS